MAETYDLDPALVRIGWALLILFTGGIFLLLYIVMALVVPLRPAGMPLWASPAAPMGDPGMGEPTMGRTGVGDPGAYPPAPGTVPPPPGSAPMGPAGAAGASAPGTYGYRYYRHPHRRDGTGALVLGAILISIGAFFLVRQFIPAFNMDFVWPLIIIVGGILLILAAVARPRSQA